MSTVAPILLPNDTDMSGNATNFFVNGTSNGSYHPMPMYIWRLSEDAWMTFLKCIAVIKSLTSATVILFNLVALIVILSSPSLRKALRNQLLLSLVVCNLLVGIFALPFEADAYADMSWQARSCFFKFLQAFIVIAAEDVVLQWGVILLLSHYVVRIQRYEGPRWFTRLPAPLQRAVRYLTVLLPWLLALLLLVPLLVESWSNFASHCTFIVLRWAYLLFVIVLLAIPMLVFVSLMIAIRVLYRRRTATARSTQGGGEGESPADRSSDTDLEPPLVYMLTAALACVFLLADNSWIMLGLFSQMDMDVQAIFMEVVSVLVDLQCAVFVLIWLLLFPDVKRRLVELAAMLAERLPCCKTKWSATSTGDVDARAVSYKELQEEARTARLP